MTQYYKLPEYKCKKCGKMSSSMCIGGICGECLEKFKQWIFMRDLEEWLNEDEGSRC